MNNHITLNASMRSNLLSLRNISKQMDKTQLILATGKEVNSAIDNASAYYQVRSLSNRAADLTALLDAMEQGIQTIEAATQGLTSGAEFLEQASAVVTEAMPVAVPEKEWFAAQDGVAAVVSNWQELKAAVTSNLTGDIVIYGNIECEESFTLKDGQNLVGVGKFGISQPDKDKYSQLSFDMAANNITTVYAIRLNGNNQISDLSVKAVSNPSKYVYVIQSASSTAEVSINNLDLMMESNSQTIGIYSGNIIFTGDNYIYEKGIINNSSSAMTWVNLRAYGNIFIDLSSSSSVGFNRCNINSFNDSKIAISSMRYCISGESANFYDSSKLVLKSTQYGVYLGSVYFHDNSSADVNTTGAFVISVADLAITSSKVKLNISTTRYFFSPASGGSNFKAVKGAQITINGKVYEINDNVDENITAILTVPPNSTVIATGVAGPEGLGDMLAENSSRVMEYQADKTNKKYSEQYKKILEEYDNLLADSSYQGINLLKGGNLEVTFNESRSNQYTVAGVLADSMSLGLETRDLFDTSAIKKSLEEITKAVNSIRSFQEELGNHYSIIQTRINFTEALTDVLETGADNLTLADINEASAEYLTLQTRQQLAINSLSLASQSAQSVLSLFV